MHKQDFCDRLLEDCLDSENISFTATHAKGVMTLMWSLTFKEMDNLQAFETHHDEIEWANLKLKFLEERYFEFHLKTHAFTEKDAVYFDQTFTPTPPVRKEWHTDTLSICGFVQFCLPKD